MSIVETDAIVHCSLECKEPDVTVVVGSGESAKEFRVYGDILAAASPVLDAMLSCGMKESETKRIKFPDKDPEEWEMFLRCIDNSSPLLRQVNDDDWYDTDPRRSPRINFFNVEALTPWFHEFQMERYLHRCDLEAALEVDSETQASRKEIGQLLDVLSLSIKYNLVRTMKSCSKELLLHIERFMWGLGDHEHFNVSIIQRMVDLSYPFKLQTVEGESPTKLVPCQQCLQSLWDRVSIFLDFSSLTVENVNDHIEFAQIVHRSLHSRHETMKSELTRLTSSWIGKEGPFYLKVKNNNDTYSFEEKFEIPMERDTLQESDMQQLRNLNDDVLVYWLSSVVSGENSCYKLSKSGKSLCFANAFVKYSDRDSESLKMDTWIRAADTLQRGIRSSETDLTVKVGSGESMKEFKCHSAILACASPKLDSLISKASGILILPHLNPDGWHLFYELINPENNGDCLNFMKYVTPVNYGAIEDYHRRRDMEYLIPFFQAFDMTNHLMYCEDILEYQIESTSDYDFDGVVDILLLAMEHNFDHIKQFAEEALTRSFDENRFSAPIKDVRPMTMQSLVLACLPIERNSTQDVFSSRSCPLIWQQINSRIQGRLETLTCLEIGRDEYEMFSCLVNSSLKLAMED